MLTLAECDGVVPCVRVRARPRHAKAAIQPDAHHRYGHDGREYFGDGGLCWEAGEQQQSKVTGSDPVALEIEIERERLEVLTTVEEKLNTANLIALIASAINTAFVISVFLYQALEKPMVRLF